MKKLWMLSSMGVLAWAMVSSCGGGGGTCGAAAPCGGEIVGTWSISSSCLSANISMFEADCPAATATGVGLKITGTITYGADMTYTSQTTTTGSVRVTFPRDCIGTTTCADIQPALRSDPQGSPTATCAA